MSPAFRRHGGIVRRPVLNRLMGGGPCGWCAAQRPGDIAEWRKRTALFEGGMALRDPEMVARAERAAESLERAWRQWRDKHGRGRGPLPPISSYVGYSIDQPWGEPRVLFGVDATEAEDFVALLDGHVCIGPIHSAVSALHASGALGQRQPDSSEPIVRIPAQAPPEGWTGAPGQAARRPQQRLGSDHPGQEGRGASRNGTSPGPDWRPPLPQPPGQQPAPGRPPASAGPRAVPPNGAMSTGGIFWPEPEIHHEQEVAQTPIAAAASRAVSEAAARAQASATARIAAANRREKAARELARAEEDAWAEYESREALAASERAAAEGAARRHRGRQDRTAGPEHAASAGLPADEQEASRASQAGQAAPQPPSADAVPAASPPAVKPGARNATAKPAARTAAARASAAKPAASTESPAATSAASAASTKSPAATSAPSAASTKSPAATSAPSAASTKSPAATGAASAAGTKSPAATGASTAAAAAQAAQAAPKETAKQPVTGKRSPRPGRAKPQEAGGADPDRLTEIAGSVHAWWAKKPAAQNESAVAALTADQPVEDLAAAGDLPAARGWQQADAEVVGFRPVVYQGEPQRDSAQRSQDIGQRRTAANRPRPQRPAGQAADQGWQKRKDGDSQARNTAV